MGDVRGIADALLLAMGTDNGVRFTPSMARRSILSRAVRSCILVGLPFTPANIELIVAGEEGEVAAFLRPYGSAGRDLSAALSAIFDNDVQ